MYSFNNNSVLHWWLIIEQYSPEIEYIPGNKNIVAYTLSQLPINGNQSTTNESMYTTETMSEIYEIKVFL